MAMTNGAVGRREWLALAGWLLASYAAAAVGGAAGSGGAWYDSLDKPWFNPPSWIFGPVWTVLFAMMGVAAWLVWRERRAPGRRMVLGLFVVHLALNAAWSWLFFGIRRPDLAFAEIIVLWTAILALVLLFWRIRPLAGALMLPYRAWVSFAAFLNFTLWQMNPGA
jgi:translocator protein